MNLLVEDGTVSETRVRLAAHIPSQTTGPFLVSNSTVDYSEKRSRPLGLRLAILFGIELAALLTVSLCASLSPSPRCRPCCRTNLILTLTDALG